MGRFRVKVGDREVEYEGEDSEAKYKDAMEWLKTAEPIALAQPNTDERQQQVRDKRGGARQAIFAAPIRKLVKEGFFKLPNRRNVPDVMKALQDRAIPVTDKEAAISNACKRLVKNGTLKGTKTAKGWEMWQE